MTLEYIRAFSTVAVVAIHTINSAIIYSYDDMKRIYEAISLAMKNIIYWAVPCFLMITGYLLLNSEKIVPLKKILGKYVLRMVLVLLTFGAGFSWIEIFFDQRTFNIRQILQAYVNVLNGNTWAHLWYIYTLIGIYLLLPLYRAATKNLNNKELIYLVIVFFVFQTIFPVFEAFTGFKLGFSINITAVFPLYLFFGEIRRRRLLTPNIKNAWVIFSISTLLIALLSVLQVFCNLNFSVLFGYSSPLTVIMSYSLFCIMEHLQFCVNSVFEKIILKISDKSFAIYIIHMFFVNIEYQFFHLKLLNSIGSLLFIPVLIVVNIICSYIVSCGMKKIPLLKKLL